MNPPPTTNDTTQPLSLDVWAQNFHQHCAQRQLDAVVADLDPFACAIDVTSNLKKAELIRQACVQALQDDWGEGLAVLFPQAWWMPPSHATDVLEEASRMNKWSAVSALMDPESIDETRSTSSVMWRAIRGALRSLTSDALLSLCDQHPAFFRRHLHIPVAVFKSIVESNNVALASAWVHKVRPWLKLHGQLGFGQVLIASLISQKNDIVDGSALVCAALGQMPEVFSNTHHVSSGAWDASNMDLWRMRAEIVQNALIFHRTTVVQWCVAHVPWQDAHVWKNLCEHICREPDLWATCADVLLTEIANAPVSIRFLLVAALVDGGEEHHLVALRDFFWRTNTTPEDMIDRMVREPRQDGGARAHKLAQLAGHLGAQVDALLVQHAHAQRLPFIPVLSAVDLNMRVDTPTHSLARKKM